MTDRELLELAAKAAGIPRARWDYEWLPPLGHKVTPEMMWRPCEDDGDALRLAVKLNLLILPNTHGTVVTVDSYTEIHEASEKVVGDPYAATRRAIMRAAAEIGKAMCLQKEDLASMTFKAPQ